MISRYISTALCAAASVPFRSGGVAASLQGEGLGERIGMEWVFDKSVFDFSFFGKSVLCISLFNCVGSQEKFYAQRMAGTRARKICATV